MASNVSSFFNFAAFGFGAGLKSGANSNFCADLKARFTARFARFSRARFASFLARFAPRFAHFFQSIFAAHFARFFTRPHAEKTTFKKTTTRIFAIFPAIFTAAALVFGASFLTGCAAQNQMQLNTNGAYVNLKKTAASQSERNPAQTHAQNSAQNSAARGANSNLPAAAPVADFKTDPRFLALNEGCKSAQTAACAALGEYFYARADLHNALKAFDYACARYGVGGACLRVGEMLYAGQGIARDERAARELYRHLCFRGENAACARIATRKN